MKIVLKHEELKVKGLPKNNIIIFFGKTFEGNFCVVYGPSEIISPKKSKIYPELNKAKVAIGKLNEKMKTYNVFHGHKYTEGGGFIKIEEENSDIPGNGDEIFFTENESLFNAMKFKETYIVK